MSRSNPVGIEWATLGQRFANLHLSLAIDGADSPGAVLANLQALRPAVALDGVAPPTYQHSYEKHLGALLGWYAYEPCETFCCLNDYVIEAGMGFFEMSGYPQDAELVPAACVECGSEFFTLHYDDVCSPCSEFQDADFRSP